MSNRGMKLPNRIPHVGDRDLPSRRWTGTIILVLLAMLGLLLRLAPLLRSGSAWAMQNDSTGYIELAAGLDSGCGFARSVDGRCAPPEVLRTPGYPLFLTVMPSLRWAVFVQGIFGAVTCLAIGLFALRYWGFGAAFLTEALLVLDVSSIVAGALVQSDEPFQLAITLAVLLGLYASTSGVTRRRALLYTLLGATLLGFSILIRPIAVFLLPFAGLPLLLNKQIDARKRISVALIALLIPTAITVGWVARNRIQAGMYTVSTIATYNLYYYRAAGVLWYSAGGSLTAWQAKLTNQLDGRIGAGRSISKALDHEMLRYGYRIILDHPVAFLRMSVESFLWLAIVPSRANLNLLLKTRGGAGSYIPAATKVRERILQLLRSPILTALVAFQLVLILIIWAGVLLTLWKLARGIVNQPEIIWLLAAAAIVLLGLASGPEAYARYRAAAMPFLAILGGIGWLSHPRRGSIYEGMKDLGEVKLS